MAEANRHALVSGGTGFIGQKLTGALLDAGYRVTVCSRDAARVRTLFDGGADAVSLREIERGDWPGAPDAIVNLAGESLNSGRWTNARKRAILDSRLHATRVLAELLGRLPAARRVLVNASAIGYYGASLTRTFTEESEPETGDFLSFVTHRWEAGARMAEAAGVRVALARFGVVLGRGGGALSQIALPYRLHAGGRIGSGRQWVSWVHVDDAVRLLLFLLDEDLQGPFNVTAPEPVTMDAFGRATAATLRRRHFLPVPAPLLAAALGRKADLVLSGQRVLPARALEAGFSFRFTRAEDALRDLLAPASARRI